MVSFNGIVREIRNSLHTIDDEQRRVSDLLDNLEILNNNTIKEGTRVRLLEDWAAKELNFSGWDGSLHFLNPSNIATIREVHVCDKTLSYGLIFDRETYFDLERNEQSVINKHLFMFKKKDFEIVEDQDEQQSV